ncbi:MAG TPA: serine/threonine-protein kinase [Planctomycetaceae bacterium]|jgi:serine/threonine protein kinase|nr:serine/threonine-protein kinase [Planctomycetaceae bacterium]
MSPAEPISDPESGETLPQEDAELFAILDRYMSSLHGGDLPSRSVLLERHPSLVKWVRHLELLDRLAPEGRPSERRSADQPRRGEDAAPQPFGKYELLGEIGRGGMGVVYRAHQTDLDRPVALKMILSSRLASPDDVRRFYAEARAAGSLRHPNIVGIHEAGEVHGQHFFAMDFIEGRSLAQELERGPFDAQRAAECVAAVGRAVQYLHDHNMIHRDLKPSNILLAPDGTPYVTDFGLAKMYGGNSAHTQSGLIVGTIGYMSPEQAAGHAPAHSPMSDIYSLGAILFELLTGRPPFQNASPIDTLLEVIESEPPRPRQLNRSIPLALELVCLRCLEKDPRRRYPSAAALVEDLEHFLRGEPLNVTPAGVIHRVLRWARREPTLAMHLGAIFISALIVQIKYMISGYDLPYHLVVMGLFAAWATVAVMCQFLLRRAHDNDIARYLWAAADTYLLTLTLYVADNPLGPLLVGYPLLIVASGLFFRVRLVTFMTVACLLAYTSLVVVGRDPIVKSHYTLIYVAALAVIGLVCGYQTYRVRVLSGYFEGRGGRSSGNG